MTHAPCPSCGRTVHDFVSHSCETNLPPGAFIETDAKLNCLACGRSCIGIREKPADTVNHPAHYTQGTIECIDYILDKKMDYLEGNIVKYITRYKNKNGVEDLKKARWYLDRLIQERGKS